jgi:hypothetical protein
VDGPRPPRDGRLATAGLLGLLLFASYWYFRPAPAWNELSRFALVRALVERGAVAIDPDQATTEDKAYRLGHHYSDKAPGAALLASPAYAAYRGLLRLRGAPPPQALPESVLRARGAALPPPDPADPGRDRMFFSPSFRRAVYLCNLTTNALAGALAGALLFLGLARAGAPPRRALAAALALGLGSPAFAYATMFYGHVLAGSALLAGFLLLSPHLRPADDAAGWSARRLLAAGALVGVAVLVELPALLGAALLGAYLLVRVPRAGRLRAAGLFAAGAVPPLLALAAYNTAAFGSPWRTGYGFVIHPTFAAGMREGLYGVTWPRPGVLLSMLVGPSRGLLYTAPVLLLGFVGLARTARRSREARLALAVVAAFLLLGASYYMWWGGAALAPRHLVPALPFLCLGIPFALGTRRGWAVVLVALLATSMAHQLAAVAVTPLAPPDVDVLRDHVYGHLGRGEIAILPGSTNVGMWLGLRGPATLLPLLGLWAVGLPLLLARLRAAPAEVGGS